MHLSIFRIISHSYPQFVDNYWLSMDNYYFMRKLCTGDDMNQKEYIR